MNIHVTKQAAEWYKQELDIDSGTIRLFVRYGGSGGRIPGFSIGINFDAPISPVTSHTVEQLNFFIEESDAWYFEGSDIHINMDEEINIPLFVNYYVHSCFFYLN